MRPILWKPWLAGAIMGEIRRSLIQEDPPSPTQQYTCYCSPTNIAANISIQYTASPTQQNSCYCYNSILLLHWIWLQSRRIYLLPPNNTATGSIVVGEYYKGEGCCFTGGQETSRIQMTQASLLSPPPHPPYQPCQQYSDGIKRTFSFAWLLCLVPIILFFRPDLLHIFHFLQYHSKVHSLSCFGRVGKILVFLHFTFYTTFCTNMDQKIESF